VSHRPAVRILVAVLILIEALVFEIQGSMRHNEKLIRIGAETGCICGRGGLTLTRMDTAVANIIHSGASRHDLAWTSKE
jgi:hypothetical protein